MAHQYSEQFNFSCEYETDTGTRKLNLYFFPFDNAIELYDIGLKRLFLRRSVIPDIRIDDLYKGAVIRVFGKTIRIIDYANQETRRNHIQQVQKVLAIIKPEAYYNIGTLISKMEHKKFSIRKFSSAKLKALEVAQFCSIIEPDDKVTNMIETLTCGPLAILELSGERAFETLKDLINSKDENFNGVWIGPSEAANLRALEHFYSRLECEFMVDWMDGLCSNGTLCIIKPHAVKEGKIGDILNAITSEGYSISAIKMCRLERKRAEDFYEIYKGILGEYHQMVTQLFYGSCIAIGVYRNSEDTQKSFRKLCGPIDPFIGRAIRPKTLRARYGTDKIMNAVHCTDLQEDVSFELNYFFNCPN